MKYIQHFYDTIILLSRDKKADLVLVSPNDFNRLEREIIHEFIVTPEIRSQIIKNGEIRIYNTVFMKSNSVSDNEPVIYESISRNSI